MALNLLDAWAQQHALPESPSAEALANLQHIPRWVDALLLCIDMGLQPLPGNQPEQPQAAPEAPAAAAAENAAAAAGPQPPAAETSSKPAEAAAPAADAAQPGDSSQHASAEKSVAERQQAANRMLRDRVNGMFLPNGLLKQQQLEGAASICMKLLQHLHAWGSRWQVPESEPSENEAFLRPQPASSAQAVLQVLALVTKSHKVALKVRSAAQQVHASVMLECDFPGNNGCQLRFQICIGCSQQKRSMFPVTVITALWLAGSQMSKPCLPYLASFGRLQCTGSGWESSQHREFDVLVGFGCQGTKAHPGAARCMLPARA